MNILLRSALPVIDQNCITVVLSQHHFNAMLEISLLSARILPCICNLLQFIPGNHLRLGNLGCHKSCALC